MNMHTYSVNTAQLLVKNEWPTMEFLDRCRGTELVAGSDESDIGLAAVFKAIPTGGCELHGA